MSLHFTRLVTVHVPSRHVSVRMISRLMLIMWLALITLPLAVTACSASTTPTPTRSPRVIATYWTAELVGELVKDDGCLRVNSRRGTSYLLVWPPDLSATIEDDTVRIVTGLVTGDRKEVVLHIGQTVRLSGGEGSISFMDEQTRQNVRANCPGPYWVVGINITPLEAVEELEGTPAVPSSEGATPAILSGEEAVVRDAQAYADRYGVDLDEAIRRLQLQDEIGDLNAELTENEEDTFAGLWIQHQPEYRVIVRFTRDGETTIRPYIENGPLAGMVEVRKARVTLTELRSARAQAAQIAAQLGIPAQSGINVFENRVELYVTDRAQFDAALRVASIQLPDYVEVVTVEELSTPVADIQE